MAEVDLYSNIFAGTHGDHTFTGTPGEEELSAVNMATGTAAGVARGLCYMISLEAWSAGEFVFRLQESDDGQNWTAVDFTEMQPANGIGGSGTPIVANGTFRLGYFGKKQNVRLVVSANVSPAATVHVQPVLGNLQFLPVVDQDI